LPAKYGSWIDQPQFHALPSFLQLHFGPDNEPKPQTPPINDPWGYKNKQTMRLDEKFLTVNNAYLIIFDGKEDCNGLREAFDGLGVDLEPVFARG